MYDPVKDGVAKSVEGVTYIEVPAPPYLADLVHCYWEMQTEYDLDEDFTLHAMPDACVNLLFNQQDTRIAGVTALQTEHTSLDLGRSFHFVGIQFFPGVWRGDPEQSVDHYVGEPYDGDLPLVAVNEQLAAVDGDGKHTVLTRLVERLRDDGLVAANPVTAAILRNLADITSVADMADVAAMSTRQLQRALKQTTGFSPHDLLKVLRIQHSFREGYLLSFADQSHYTHSFRKITGYTPRRFEQTFDV
ncbi:MAG: AraC family transcriptional regulator [Actinomycetota bacterium]